MLFTFANITRANVASKSNNDSIRYDLTLKYHIIKQKNLREVNDDDGDGDGDGDKIKK